MNNKFKTVDLFAGIGGIGLGFKQAGFQAVYATDFDEKCKETYDLNSKGVKLTRKDITKKSSKESSSVLDDVRKLNYDVLLAGFPCQAFSIAGYREGFKDKKGRGNLFFYIAEIIEKTKPTAFLLENVKNLEGHDKKETYKIIKKTLEDLGYIVDEKILNSMDYGNVPQNRERIYIVGFKTKKVFKKFEWPKKLKRTVDVADLLDDGVDDDYYYNGKPLNEKLNVKTMKKNRVYQWRRVYLRENKSGVCPTLTANMGMGGHNVPIVKNTKGARKLTPEECLRIQGYDTNTFKLPKTMAKSHLYKQIGNSVSVPVVKRIAKKIKIALS
jgi:DNA (cytosine-5)-methyltransferase 1